MGVEGMGGGRGNGWRTERMGGGQTEWMEDRENGWRIEEMRGGRGNERE